MTATAPTTLYTLDPPLCIETQMQCMRMSASLEVTAGDAALTPTAVQWVLSVRIEVNGGVLAFDFVENLLRCFVSGSFMVAWATDNEPPMYEQQSTGFEVVFSRGNALPPVTANRSQVKTMSIALELAQSDDTIAYADQNSLFQDTLSLADYAFTIWMRSAETIAPAVFTSKYKRISSMQPYFRPLKVALGLPRDSAVLEQIAERALVGGGDTAQLHVARNDARPKRSAAGRHQQTNTDAGLHGMDPSLTNSSCPSKLGPRPDQPSWRCAGEFFRSAPFESRRFVVLTGETDEVHECVFLSQLLEQA